MEFWVHLIKIEKEQGTKAEKFLQDNCTSIHDGYYFFEGWDGCLYDNDVRCQVFGEYIVPSLGDMSKNELIQLVNDISGIKIKL